MIALTFAGLVAVRRGEVARAVLPLQRSFEICRNRGLTVWHPVSASLLGLALVRLGNEQRSASPAGGQCQPSAGSSGSKPICGVDGQSRRRPARRRSARAGPSTAREALALGSARPASAVTRRTRCGCWADRADAGAYEKALSLAHELGMLPLAAQTHLDFGHQLAARGEAARAQEHIGRGQELLKQMQMRAWYDSSRTGSKDNAHLYIVARSNPQLYEFLTQEFTGERGIKVVLDRREHVQREVKGNQERRLHPVDEDLRAWELALTSANHP